MNQHREDSIIQHITDQPPISSSRSIQLHTSAQALHTLPFSPSIQAKLSTFITGLFFFPHPAPFFFSTKLLAHGVMAPFTLPFNGRREYYPALLSIPSNFPGLFFFPSPSRIDVSTLLLASAVFIYWFSFLLIALRPPLLFPPE